MFITAACVLFQEQKSLRLSHIFVHDPPQIPQAHPTPPPNIVGSLEFHMADCTRYKTQSCEQFGEVNTAAIR